MVDMTPDEKRVALKLGLKFAIEAMSVDPEPARSDAARLLLARADDAREFFPIEAAAILAEAAGLAHAAVIREYRKRRKPYLVPSLTEGPQEPA